MTCAYSMCDKPTIARVKLTTGWGKVCRHHYDLLALNSGIKACADAGLITIEEKIAYCRKFMLKQVEPNRNWQRDIEALRNSGGELSVGQIEALRARERQPGEDREEDEAF